MKQVITELIIVLALALLPLACGGDDESGADGDADSDREREQIYIPPDRDGDDESADTEGDDSDGDGGGEDGDIDNDGIEYLENIPDDEREAHECDPYTAVESCLSVEYPKDTRRYCDPPGNWRDESCAPGACVTDGASAWCVGKEDPPDGDDDFDEIENDSPQLVDHQCTSDLTLKGLPCLAAYDCPDICGLTIFCYACNGSGACALTGAGQGSCAEPEDGDTEQELELSEEEFETELELEPELEPEAENDANICGRWYCTANLLHYCAMNQWDEFECPGLCVDDGLENAYCQ